MAEVKLVNPSKGEVRPRTDKSEGRIAAKHRAVMGKLQVGALPLAGRLPPTSDLRYTNIYYCDGSNPNNVQDEPQSVRLATCLDQSVAASGAIAPTLLLATLGGKRPRPAERCSNSFQIATSCTPTRAMTPTPTAARLRSAARSPTSRPKPTANGRTASRRSSTATPTPSSPCSAASRTSRALPHDTTETPPTSSPPSASPPRSAIGYKSGP